jgi:type III secretion protein L
MGLAVLIDSEKLRLLSERRVIKAAEYALLLDAQAALDAAREEARRMAGEARRVIEEHCRMGYEQGVEHGRQAWAQRLCEAALDSHATLQQLKSTVADVVVRAVREIVQTLDPGELWAATFARVEPMVRDQATIKVRVAPQEGEAAYNALLATCGHLHAALRFEPDASLGKGVCVIETPGGTVEAGLESQLELLREVLSKWDGP